MATVLIIAGGDISNKLPFLRVESPCPALMPLNTRSLASYVMEYYRRAKHDVHLFVDNEFCAEVTAELAPQRHGYTLHGVHRGQGVVDSLQQALQAVVGATDIIVNLVTTIPVADPEMNEVQGGRLPVHSTTSWSALSLGQDEDIYFHGKGQDRPNDSLAFTGVFRLPANVLSEAIELVACRKDLLGVVEQASHFCRLKLKEVEWIDCGHETNYYRSRAALINSRSFNHLRVDISRGTIIKSSSDREKLSREVSYYQTLPNHLRVLFPRLVSVSGGDGQVDSYEMEYYGYPNIAEYLLYWNLSKDNWWRCFDGLHSTLSLFRQHPASIGPASYENFHWKKTLDRIEQYVSLLEPPLREALIDAPLQIGGKLHPPLSQLLEGAEKVITQGYRENEFSTVHGDFCFNNILYDVASGVIRLIDPRGSFGTAVAGTLGDRRYDLAKLAHSAIGHYDYMVNGLFYVMHSASTTFDLEIGLRANAPWLEEMTRWLILEQKADAREINVMTALLFLSMCPLHADDHQRQLAFFLRGIQLLHQSLL
jgi:hypothetical protein